MDLMYFFLPNTTPMAKWTSEQWPNPGYFCVCRDFFFFPVTWGCQEVLTNQAVFHGMSLWGFSCRCSSGRPSKTLRSVAGISLQGWNGCVHWRHLDLARSLRESENKSWILNALRFFWQIFYWTFWNVANFWSAKGIKFFRFIQRILNQKLVEQQGNW